LNRQPGPQFIVLLFTCEYAMDLEKPQSITVEKIQRGDKDRSGLTITLLGPPTILWNEQALCFSRRQVRALLFRLAANLKPVSREELCFLFWSDEAQSSARRNLTHLLTHLRLALPQPDLLDITKENVAFNSQKVRADTAQFDQLLARHKEFLPAAYDDHNDLNLALETLAKAIQLYQGPFLSGFTLPNCQEFEGWASQERRGYECRYLEAVLNMIEVYQDYKDYETAITYARRYLEIDNLAEDIHCKLIELYAAKGDNSAAERQFEQLTAILEQELGISPSAKSWSVYQSVLGSRQSVISLPSQALADRSRTKLDTPFIGRAEILRQLDRYLSLARQGRSKIILIGGEPGIGKSRLLQQIASQYRCHATILFSACNPGMQNLPYHPVAEAFRASIENHAPGFKVNPLWLAESARLLPEIYTRYPDLPQPLPAKPEEARRRLFEALYQLAVSLSSKFCPVLICLDDLHWADATTKEWLVYLGNRLAFEGLTHLMVIATYRNDDEQYRLSEFRFALYRLGVMDELPLEGLEEDQVCEYLNHLFGSSEDNQALSTRLLQVSGGNPLFLFEVLRILIDNQNVLLRLPNLDDIPIPKTIQEAIHQRLVSLTSTWRKILEIAAVINRPITNDVIQKATGLSELEILECLEALTTRRLVTEQDGRYQFHHELMRMVIYNELGYDRRRFLHRHCGKILEYLHPEETTLLAWHFEQSGDVGKAADYALRSGEKAYKLYAFPETLDMFSRALSLLKLEAAGLSTPEQLSINYRKQIQALSRRGNAFRALGDMRSYQNDFEEEAHIARLLGDSKVQAHVYLREANAHRWFCRYVQAQESAEKALQIGRKIGNKLINARARREIGLALRAVGDFSNARQALEEALQGFKELGEAGYEIHTLCNLSTLYAYLGDFRSSEQLAASALGCCEQAHLPYLRRIALGDLGVALAELGQVQPARECLLVSLEIARQIADRSQEIFCLCYLGWLENHLGRPEAALHYLSEGLTLAERLDSRAEQSRLYINIAEAHRLLQNNRLAKAFAYKALELSNRHGRVYDHNLAQRVLTSLKSEL
jgi:predicted ATPase/DNA-binding SARP family transcriptional activator